ncbi:MAG: NAD-glutamate dehydrogenase [Planctomycetota bacterium]|nr:NAD-glutamate dehydrogenase [Planctomycetota bacterium]
MPKEGNQKRENGRLVGLLDPMDLRLADARLAPILRDFLEQYDAVLDELYDEKVLRRLARDLLNTFNLVLHRSKNEVLVCLDIDQPTSGNRTSIFLDVVCDDQPFVVDTIEMIIKEHNLQLISKHTASASVVREKDGTIVAFDATAAKSIDEVFCHFEIDSVLDSEKRDALLQDIHVGLAKVTTVVKDFKRMQGVIRDSIRAIRRCAAGNLRGDLQTTRDMLEWLFHDHFVFFGVNRWIGPEGENPALEIDLSLGVACPADADIQRADQAIQLLSGDSAPSDHIVSFKGMGDSCLHRHGKIDHFVVSEPTVDGMVRFVHIWGLFTYKAVQTPGDQIPHVRNKLEQVISYHSIARGGLRYKSFQNSFNSIPVEFLFQAEAKEIESVIQAIHYVERSKEIRGHLVVDEERRKGLYFLAIPREGYSEEQRDRIEAIVSEMMRASYTDSRVNLGKHGTVLLSFFFTASELLDEVDSIWIDERVRLVAGTWADRLNRQFDRTEEVNSDALFRLYKEAFPEGYQILHSPAEGVLDAVKFEQLRVGESTDFAFAIFRSNEDRAKNSARLRIYQRKNMFLSTTLPILDNFGLKIVDQNSFKITPSTGERFTMDTFQVHGVDSDDHPLIRSADRVTESLEAIFSGATTSDQLDRLILEVGIDHRDVDLLRNQLHYLHQLGISTTIAFASQTLSQYAGITRDLLEFYRIRFDPELDLVSEERESRSKVLRDKIIRSLNAVRSSAQDIFLRRILGILDSTLRTTRFNRRDEPLQAYKFDSMSLPVGSHPRPWREIFVHHPEIEGVHLRGGPLARGGLRWSDRITDYRTEVHGLQRTQMVKNVLIVPVGAKGGFVLRKPSSDRSERRVQADQLYKLFIEGLLILTDNVIDGKVIPPAGLIRRDGDDPYLVVAADKGTAHLSDTANAISHQHNFWLGDAFASGGCHGYDHKELAITARGAWEQALIHFRSLDIDPHEETYSVVGIGDMSGDVFGNGMLLARNAKLIAAFNHLHIFIDPDPDFERSYAERERLFHQDRSNWGDFDRSVLSEGGEVFDRSEKTIDPSAIARVLLGLPPDGVFSPEEVIRAILCAQVDMLFNGGIGTYIRSSLEPDLSVDDSSNSACRVTGKAVRARIMVEGGNLGVTPRGRIELSRGGMMINTDFVDNSGGVDCSDHEVNLKTLLFDEVHSGRLSEDQRNEILTEVQQDVCEHVLRNNREQGLLLSLDEIRSEVDPFSIERTMMILEDRGILDREAEALPTQEELTTRHTDGIGLFRPELAIVAAHAKMDVYQRLLLQPVGRVDELRYLRDYFPAAIQSRFAEAIQKHQLGREIAMTVLTNRIVDRAGSFFFLDMERETGRSIGHIARSYFIADDLIGAEQIRDEILSLRKVSAKVVNLALVRIQESLRRTAAWLLSSHDDDRLDRIEGLLAEGVRPLEEYEDSIPDCLSGPELDRHENHIQEALKAGFSPALAQSLAKFEHLTAGVRILDISRTHDIRVGDVARIYYLLGHRSGLHPLVRKCDEMSFSGRWDSLSMRILRNTFLDGLWALVTRICGRNENQRKGDWIEVHIEDLRRKPSFKAMESDIRRIGSEELSIASIQVLSVRFRRFVQ